MVHRFVYPPAVGDEPVIDAAEFGDHHALDAGFLGHFPDRGLLGGLALLDMALGQRPQQPSASIGAADQGGAALFAWAVETVDDEAARGGLLDRAHAWSRRVSGRTSAPGLAASTVRAIGRGHQAILIDAGGATVHSPAYGRGSAATAMSATAPAWVRFTFVVSTGPDPAQLPAQSDPAQLAPDERRTRLLAAAAVTLGSLGDVLTPLGELFAARGFQLYLVGGSVRDAILGRLGTDLDFTT